MAEAGRKRAGLELRETQRLAQIALHDALTGLPNRTAIQHLELALRRAKRFEVGVAVMFIDLDNFKLVNDSLGHPAGDELLNNGWVSMLKLEPSFVQSMTVDPHAYALVEAVAQLAQKLDLLPLAEGVETEAQRRLLLTAGFVFGQGFPMSRPLPIEELEALLDSASHRRYAA